MIRRQLPDSSSPVASSVSGVGKWPSNCNDGRLTERCMRTVRPEVTFECRDGERGRKLPPSSMPTLAAAREEAVRCAIDLLIDLQPGTDNWTGWFVRLWDENGELLYTIDVQEAEATRQTRQ